jgi:hypothetical protein
MPKWDAKQRLREYRASVHLKADREYQAAVKAYAALARGTPIIVLSQSFALAPLDEKGRVRLALARADQRQIRLQVGSGRWSFMPAQWLLGNTMRALSRSTLDPRALSSAPDGYALVPMIPPDVRKKRALDAHWILWEVPQWADVMIRAKPPVDPLLLKHLGGEAYAVVGEWELTEVERAIMAGTRA